MQRILFLLLFSASLGVQGAQCKASSPQTTTALVELYTSEGCDSCPPADRWLSSLGPRGFAPDRVVPLALHVDYWDGTTSAGRTLTPARPTRRGSGRWPRLARAAMVYTPQVLLQGQDFRAWGSASFDVAVAKINARPAKARISLSLDGRRKDALDVEVVAELENASADPANALFLGAYENKLVTEVKAGENRGKTLPHDYVVLQWAGPLEFKAGRLAERHALPLLPKVVPAHSGVVAFVQNRANGEVLQALMLPSCKG